MHLGPSTRKFQMTETYNFPARFAHNMCIAAGLWMPLKLVEGCRLRPQQVLRAVSQAHLWHNNVMFGHRKRVDPTRCRPTPAVHPPDELPLIGPGLHSNHIVTRPD